MRPVSELYGRHVGEDIYVVGTGTSIRVFPRGFLEGKITIGLNMAWKNAPLTYAITIHPDLNVPEFIGEQPHPEITWIAPRGKSRALLRPEHFADADASFYTFDYHGQPNTQPMNEPSDSGRILEWLEQPSENNLYVWSSIAQTAANLAANMGARNIILVGCDNGPLAGNHHAHKQHTRWKGVTPEYRYNQYYEGMAEVREVLRQRSVNVVSLQPFLGVDGFDEDFARLCGEFDRAPMIASVDISPARPNLRHWIISRIRRFALRRSYDA